METAVRPLFLGLNPKIITYKKTADFFIPFPRVSSKRTCFSLKTGYRKFHRRASAGHYVAIQAEAVSSGVEDIKVLSSQLEDFSVTTTSTSKADELKISVEVSGDKTQAIFDNVFSNMVADAQPIPGFRRMKGGKTPNIPRDILLQVLGPSKVYKQVIKKVINSTVAEYVEKEGLKVGKDLRVEQSFEDLEAAFEPGDKFIFDAIVQCRGSN